MVNISIIVPIFNGKKYIKETVEELLKIKINKEILLIDDGSRDGSYEYCCSLWGTCPEIKIFEKPNSGIVDTRNFGLLKATGDYLLFCDHDDIIYPHVVDQAIVLAEKNGLDSLIWSTVRLIEKGKTIPCDTVYEDCIILKDEIQNVLIPSMLINSCNNRTSYLGHIWAGIYKRSIVVEEKIVFKKFVDIEDDYLFVFDFLNKSSKLGFVHKIGYAWRFNQNSETYRLKYIDHILERYNALYKYLLQCIKSIKVPSDVLENFESYRIQNSLIMSIENSFTSLKNSRECRAEIKRFYNKNKKYFDTKSIFPYKKRRKRIFYLLHHRLLVVAECYVYLDSIYRRAYKRFVNSKDTRRFS